MLDDRQQRVGQTGGAGRPAIFARGQHVGAGDDLSCLPFGEPGEGLPHYPGVRHLLLDRHLAAVHQGVPGPQRLDVPVGEHGLVVADLGETHGHPEPVGPVPVDAGGLADLYPGVPARAAEQFFLGPSGGGLCVHRCPGRAG